MLTPGFKAYSKNQKQLHRGLHLLNRLFTEPSFLIVAALQITTCHFKNRNNKPQRQTYSPCFAKAASLWIDLHLVTFTLVISTSSDCAWLGWKLSTAAASPRERCGCMIVVAHSISLKGADPPPPLIVSESLLCCRLSLPAVWLQCYCSPVVFWCQSRVPNRDLQGIYSGVLSFPWPEGEKGGERPKLKPSVSSAVHVQDLSSMSSR